MKAYTETLPVVTARGSLAEGHGAGDVIEASGVVLGLK